MSASLNERISDIRVRWSHLLSWRPGRQKDKNTLSFADFTSLVETAIDPDARSECEVVIPMPPEATLLEIRDWLDDPEYRWEYKLFGRVVWTRKKYHVEKTLVGLRFQFDDIVSATAFRFRWL